MSQELHYTSVPRGLKPGSRGFCTVASTPGVSSALVERLESLSAYQPVYPMHDPAAANNPVNFMHLKPAIGGKSLSILSRVGPAGLDYSGRMNKYAHHIVLEQGERPAGGPAWLLCQPGFVQDGWRGEPRLLPEGTRPPQGDRPPGVALTWQALTGDAGWAGVLAEAFLADSRRTALVVFQPGMDLLPLFAEAIALLPLPRRWDVEFSTFFSTLPPGVNCSWRGVIEGSPEAEAALRLPGSLVINLCRPGGNAEGRALVQQARTGERPQADSGPDDPAIVHPPGRHAPSAAGRHAAPPSRPRAASHGVAPPLGSPAGAGHPPLAPGARRASRKPVQSWAIVAGIVAACLAGVIATVLFLRPQPGAIPKVTQSQTQSQNRQTEAAAPEIKPANKDLAATTKDSGSAKPIERKNDHAVSTGPDPKAAEKPRAESDKTEQETRAYIAALGLPLNAILGKDNPADAGPGAHDPSNESRPAVIRNVVLAFDLKEPGKDSATLTLDLARYTEDGDAVSELALIKLNKPANDSGKFPHAALDPVDTGTLDVMISVPAGLGREEQALAHFKAGGRRLNFNWDDGASSRLAEESKNLLRECILKIVTQKGEVLYALLKERPRDRSDPLGIRDEVAAKVRANRKAAPKVDVAWDGSDKPQVLYLRGKLILSQMKARSRGSEKELKLVESETSGEWVCKGKTGRIMMTTDIRESDNKLRFTFSQNRSYFESRLAAFDQAQSDGGEASDPTAKDDKLKPDALKQQRTGLEDDLQLFTDLVNADFSFVIGLKIDDQKVVELVRIGDFAREKTP
jgi:hypothetical protein